MSKLWSVALLLVCPCLACPAGESSSSNAAASSTGASKDPAPTVAPDKPTPTDVLVLPAAGAEPEPIDVTSITITPDEAAAAGLPKLGFSLDTTDTGMSGTRFGNREYLHLSGPPGGPMILQISPATIGAKLADVVGSDLLRDATLVEEQVELLGCTATRGRVGQRRGPGEDLVVRGDPRPERREARRPSLAARGRDWSPR
jgi:hypothetical protein